MFGVLTCIHALTYAGIQIRGGKGFKPHKPYCDLAIKYVKKDGVFPPIKIHKTFVILCICVQIQMQQLEIATDKIIELPDVVLCDVRIYYPHWVKLEKKKYLLEISN